MRLVFGLVLVVGLGLAGFAVYMAQNYIGAYQAELAKERAVSAKAIKTVGVYVVSKSLKYGEAMTSEDVELIAWPEKYIPEGAFTEESPAFDERDNSPRFVLRAMEKYEPVMAIKVTEQGEDAGLISRLAKGKTAFAIKVDATSGVSGFLRPGDKVDVYWTGTTPSAGPNQPKRSVTRLIQTNVDLIAIDQTANSENSEASIANTVTVAVSRKQVLSLAQAQANGKLTLSLVGIGDDTVAEAIEVDQRTLLGITEEEKVAAAEEERECKTTVNKGTEKIQIVIPCT